jgi:transcriptional regulator with XRE-family HTH domain
MWVCREDFDPQNDNVDNLRYDTPAGSAAGMPEEIKRARGIHKLTDQQVVEIRTRYATDKKLTHKELAVEHNVTTGAIDRACTGKSYSYLDGPRTIHKFQPRVSDQIAQTILLRLNFETARSLAEEYGIHESTISRWKNGTNRRELTSAS